MVVLKGHRTIIASPHGEVAENPTGNPGMATGGSGDVLAGVIASLLAQGKGSLAAAWLGVLLHATAGDAAAKRQDSRSIMASDLLDGLCHIFQE